MRFITLLFILLLVPFTAYAGSGSAPYTPVSKEMANKYFANCVQSSAATEQRFSPDAQQMFCACTAARLNQFYSVEDMTLMNDTANPDSRLALNRMIINIYAPCMEVPMKEYHYAQCISNPQTAQLSSNPQAMCQCAAEQLGIQMKVYGSQLFEQLLARSPLNEDPMTAIYNDPSFQTMAQKKAIECLK